LPKRIVAAINEGRLDPALLARIKQRIESLLDRAANNKVALLPEGTFRAHAGLGEPYDAGTVEVVSQQG
jgi:hypothetical protein